MRNPTKHLLLSLAFLPVLAGSLNAAVSFTVTPAAISNTYAGTVTLQINGLTNSETVVVQKFLDLNSNGVVDAGDLLMEQFQLTDGAASVFYNGGTPVTNYNVPGDLDGAVNSSITANLYPSFDFAQLIIGKYLLVLSSPAGQFSPMTNSFAVTNFPFGQSFAGHVVNNGTNVPNAIVMLFQPSSGGGLNPQGGVVADNLGAYAIKASTGTYTLGALRSNFVANLSASPAATLGAGATITTNVPLAGATYSLSGKVVEMGNSSIGLGGLLLPFKTSGQDLALAFTDTNGNFTAGVTPNQWKIGGTTAGLAAKGYLLPQNSPVVDATSGGVSGLSVSFPKATAIFYGTVKDGLGNPLPGITALYSADNYGQYETDGFTDTNGNYAAGAIGGLGGDQWQVSEDYDNGSLTGYVISLGPGNVTLNAGQAYHYNFIGIPATNHISGHVQFNGANVVGVDVNATSIINGNAYQPVTAHTDSNGNYSLAVANGDWSVNVNCNGGSDSLDNILGNGSYLCPNSQDLLISNNSGIANFTVAPNGGDIVGYVSDSYGYGVGGVAVHISNGAGGNYSTSTDMTGYYTLLVANGIWNVSADCGQLTGQGYQCVGTNEVSVSDNSVEQDFTAPLATVQPFSLAALHDFSVTGTNADFYYTNSDGAGLYGGLVLAGNTLYGTASSGGTNGAGTVFSDATNTNNPGFKVLHTLDGNGDGGYPYAGLSLSGSTLYGTAEAGGTNGNGTVFAATTNGGFSVLYAFTPLDAGTETTNSDGAYPQAGVILSGGTLYGAANFGGTNGNGTLFAVTTNGGFRIVHTFTALDDVTATTNSDGAKPAAGLIISGDTLYGTATYGGTNGNGTVFSVKTNGTGFTVLHTFEAFDLVQGTNDDGAYPNAGLILSGNTLYGTTFSGGDFGGGTVFALNTNGTGFTALHSFTFGGDGNWPSAGLVLAGNILYGTTTSGGDLGYGTVFGVTTDGTGFTIPHRFTGGSDGAYPYAGLVSLGNNLYGTTSAGGLGGNGTVFSLSLASAVGAPQLTIIHSGAGVVLAWPANATGFALQATTNLDSPSFWSTNLPSPVVVNGQNTVSNLMSGKQTFFRLSQ